MAVDKAIEYKMQGGVKNYRPSKMVTAPRIAKSSPDTPTAKLAYITPEEEKILIDLNLYGSLKGKPNRGPSGIPSLEGDFGGPGGYGGYQGGGGGRQDNDVSGSRDRGTGDYRVTDRAVQDAYNKNRAIREANERAADKLAGRDPRLSGGIQTNRGPMGRMGGIFGSILGMMMGIPGLGLLTGGFDKLKGGLGSLNETLGDFREKTTGYRTQKDYDDARRDRQLQGRLDDMYAAKSKGKGFSQKNIDMIEAMGFQPSTAQNVLTGRDLKGFTPSRMGLQKQITPMAKPTFSDPFANTVGTTTKVNAPASDAVSSYSYGKADAAIPGVETTPSYINEFLNKPRTPGKSSPFSNFIDELYNPEQIAALENEYGSKYGITNTSGGISSDARHMAAMNNLSNSLSPFNNKFGNFIGDTGAFAAGLINELPALGRGFNKENLGEIVEDIKANYAGSFGTPNQTTAEQIYGDVFEGSIPARTASVPTYGTAAAAEVRPAIGMENTGLGFSVPTGDVGLNASGRLGNLSATVDAIDALKGESVNPALNYSGTFDNTLLGGQTNVFGNFSDDVQNLGLNFNNDKGLSGGISYDAITGEPRFDIGFRRTFADGGLASMFTRRG